MRKLAAWGIVILVGVGGYYLSAWMMLPLVKVFAAHTNPAAAVGLALLRLLVWLAMLVGAVVFAAWVYK